MNQQNPPEAIAMSIECSWWGTRTEAKITDRGSRVCPECGAVTLTIDQGQWLAGLKKIDETTPGYFERRMKNRGVCVATFAELAPA